MAYTQAVVAISMILASATAAGQATSASKPAKAANENQAVKYCVETEPFTGSKIAKTECKTKAEWAAEGVDVDQLNKH
jgi:hypothetical protein